MTSIPHVLLVEDETLIAIAQKLALERYHYRVSVASSGEEALQKVQSLPDVDLVLMDINLGAGWDGTQAAQAILKVRDLPIVFLSSHTEPEIVAKTEGISSYGYVVKASSATVLDASIKMAFKLFEAKQALLEAQARQHTLLENIPEVITVVDDQVRVKYTSPNIEKWFGWSVDDEPGRSRWDRVHPDDRDESHRAFHSVASGEVAVAVVRLRYRCKDGSYKPIEIRVTDHTKNPLIQGVLLTYHDVSATLALETALVREQSLLKTVLESSPDPILAKDLEGRYVVVNQQAAWSFGQDPDEILGRTAEASQLPEVAAQYQKTDEEVLTSGKTVVADYRVPTARGTRDLRAHKAPWRDPSGKIIGVVGIVQDVTEGKLAEQELIRQRNLLQAIINSIPGNVFAKNLDGRYWAINAAGARKSGHSVAEVLGKTNFELYPREQAEDYQRSDEVVLSTGETVEDEELVPTTQGLRTMVTQKSLWRDEEGQALGVIGVASDVTDRVEAHRQIEALLAEKDMLLREVHHRIKNNLATVAGLLTVQAAESQDPRVISALESARNRVSAMTVLYDRLYQTEEYREVPSADYLGALVDEIAQTFVGSRVTVETRIAAIPLDLRTVQSLGIIVNELLTNALKYAFPGQAGWVRITADHNDSLVTVVVQDNGPGMVGEPPSGGGFGLRLVSFLTANLRGTVRYENDHGTRVIVEFPGQRSGL